MAAPKTIEVLILEPVLHDGVDLSPGVTASLPRQAAMELVQLGAARLPGDTASGGTDPDA